MTSLLVHNIPFTKMFTRLEPPLVYQLKYNIIIEIHAPTSSTKKAKLIGKEQFTYISNTPLAWRFSQVLDM